MPAAAVARNDGTDTIATNHGCDSTTVTDEGSSDVFVNGKGVVRAEDLCEVHLIPAGIVCVPVLALLFRCCSCCCCCCCRCCCCSSDVALAAVAVVDVLVV